MQLKKEYIILIMSILIVTGCAIKDQDSSVTKTLKHTINSPLYLVLGVGEVATKATELAILVPAIAVAKVVKGDSPKIKKLRKLAHEGDAKSQTELVYSYQYAISLPKDLNKARYWYEKASLNNYNRGTHNLGILYYNGYGIQVNKQKAHELFLVSANQNFADSQNALGYIHAADKDFKNFELSINWYEKAIKNGHLKAKCNIVYPLLESDTSINAKQKAKEYITQTRSKVYYKYCNTLWTKYKLDTI